MSGTQKVAFVVFRTMLALIFVNSGVHKILGWSQTAGYMASKGMPVVPFFLAMTILVEVGAGLALIFGFKPNIAAGVLAAFMVPVTLIFHNFWASPAAEQQMQMMQFIKNVAIIGGLGMTAISSVGEKSCGEASKTEATKTVEM